MAETEIVAVSKEEQSAIMEQLLIGGDLEKLSPAQRITYYHKVCSSIGVNPWTKPFGYIRLNGKLTLYALRDCAEQLRKIHGVSVTEEVSRFDADTGLYVVQVKGADKTGRLDVATGATATAGLKGENLVNALLKAETKAKRRLTLSICGLGWLDETEVASIEDAQVVTVNEKGEVVDKPANGKKSAAPKERLATLLAKPEDEDEGTAGVTAKLPPTAPQTPSVAAPVDPPPSAEEIESRMRLERLEEMVRATTDSKELRALGLTWKATPPELLAPDLALLRKTFAAHLGQLEDPTGGKF